MREKIKLESSAGTGHFYTTSKNKKLMPGKMEIKTSTKRGAVLCSDYNAAKGACAGVKHVGPCPQDSSQRHLCHFYFGNHAAVDHSSGKVKTAKKPKKAGAHTGAKWGHSSGGRGNGRS